MSLTLSARYEELRRVESELQRAEQALLAAHLNHANAPVPRPEAIYLQVIALRQQSRRLLDQCADAMLAVPSGGPVPLETQGRVASSRL